MSEPRRTDKAENTRAQILDTALSMFRERGFDGTSMRAIAEEAGVSVGNAYYYFKSKDELVFSFYERTFAEHLAVAQPILKKEKSFKTRLKRMIETKIETIMPYRRLTSQLFRTAADPESPLNPFGEQSEDLRNRATEVMREVVEGSRQKIHKELAPALPQLLWFYEMSIILFFIHDESRNAERTFRLVDRTVDIVVGVVKVLGLPLLGSVRRSSLSLLEELAAPH